MTTTSTRRAVLAGAAALPVLALPAMAGQQSDRELFALDRELIFATQAHTIDGIKIKFRTAERMDPQ